VSVKPIFFRRGMQGRQFHVMRNFFPSGPGRDIFPLGINQEHQPNTKDEEYGGDLLGEVICKASPHTNPILYSISPCSFPPMPRPWCLILSNNL